MSFEEKPDYVRRAGLLLQVIITAGGVAGPREVWLRVNRGGHQMSDHQVRLMLSRMEDRGHVRGDHRGPVIYEITQSGRDWLRRQKGKGQ